MRAASSIGGSVRRRADRPGGERGEGPGGGHGETVALEGHRKRQRADPPRDPLAADRLSQQGEQAGRGGGAPPAPPREGAPPLGARYDSVSATSSSGTRRGGGATAGRTASRPTAESSSTGRRI